jgi:hypothetical protein
MKTTTKIVMLIVFSLQNPSAWAESAPPPAAPVPSQPTPTVPTVIPPQTQSGFFSNPNTITNTLPIDNVSGREQKANSATGTGNAGQGAAIGAGIALMSASAAAFAALNIPLGVTLATMGAIEFAQAGSTGNTAAANNAQENTLRYDDNALGAQSPNSYNPSEVANAINSNPAIPAALSNLGVNPEEFINGIVNGEFTTPEQVISAIGQEGNFTASEVAAMGNFENVNLGAIVGEEEGNAAASVLGMDEGSRSVASSSASGSKSGDTGTFSITAGTGNGGGAAGGLGAGANGKNGSAVLGASGEAAGSFAGANGMFGNGRDVAGFGAAGLAGLDRMQLKDMGILKPHGKTTIFQIATRNFKSFNSWRKSKKLAKSEPTFVRRTIATAISLK